MRGIIKTVGGVVVGGVAVFAGTSATDDNTTRDDTGAVVEAGGLGAFVMQIGDCVQLPDAQEIQSVEAVPCGQAHDAQVYAEFLLSGDDWPGEESIEMQSAQGCYERWPAAVSADYDNDPAHDFTFFSPLADGWSNGDREVTCMVVNTDASPISGSLLG